MFIDPDGDAPAIDFPIELLERTSIARLSYLKEVESSNTFALERLANGEEVTPWLVVAHSQTAGRGRGENRWWSEAGSLTFSLVVDAEEFALRQLLWPRLSMAVGLAICQILEKSPWQLPMQIKWPNDVYVNGKKLGGILIEHSGSRLVIGVGLNVNQRLVGAPEEVRERATSLLLEKRSACDGALLLVDVVKEVLSILPLVAQEYVDFAREAGERNYLQWRKVRICQGNLIKEGICTGIDFDGGLLIQTEAGIERILSGTVELAGK